MTLEELIDDIKKQPEFVSVEVLTTPEFLTNQLKVIKDGITITDQDTVLVDAKFLKENDSLKPVRFVLNNEHLSTIPNQLNVSRMLIDEIVYCDDSISQQKGSGSYNNILDNMGDPPTFYINPVNMKSTRINSYATEPITLTPEVSELIENLKQIPNVNKVLIEYARCEEIKKIVDDESAVVITLYKNETVGPITAFYSLSIINDPVAIPFIVDNIKNNLNDFTTQG
jgi:HD superfamily phosphohydrolase